MLVAKSIFVSRMTLVMWSAMFEIARYVLIPSQVLRPWVPVFSISVCHKPCWRSKSCRRSCFVIAWNSILRGWKADLCWFASGKRKWCWTASLATFLRLVTCVSDCAQCVGHLVELRSSTFSRRIWAETQSWRHPVDISRLWHCALPCSAICHRMSWRIVVLDPMERLGWLGLLAHSWSCCREPNYKVTNLAKPKPSWNAFAESQKYGHGQHEPFNVFKESRLDCIWVYTKSLHFTVEDRDARWTGGCPFQEQTQHSEPEQVGRASPLFPEV